MSESGGHNLKKVKKRILLTSPHDGSVIPYGIPKRRKSKLPDSCSGAFELREDLSTSKTSIQFEKIWINIANGNELDWKNTCPKI